MTKGVIRTAGGKLPVPAKKIGQWMASRKRDFGNFLRKAKVMIGSNAPIQKKCRRPEYIFPILYSLVGPIAVALSVRFCAGQEERRNGLTSPKNGTIIVDPTLRTSKVVRLVL